MEIQLYQRENFSVLENDRICGENSETEPAVRFSPAILVVQFIRHNLDSMVWRLRHDICLVSSVRLVFVNRLPSLTVS